MSPASRRCRSLLRLCLLAATAAHAGTAGAQGVSGTDSADEPGAPLYRVEVILFLYNDADAGEEHFASSAAKPSIPEPERIDTFNFLPWTGFPLLPLDGEPADAAPVASPALANARRGIERGNLAAPERDAAGPRREPETSSGPAPDPADAPDPAGEAGPNEPAEAIDRGAGAEAAGDEAGAERGEAERVASFDAPPSRFGGEPDIAFAPFPFRLLESGELTLTRERRRLETIDAYTPLAHGGWIQEGLASNAAEPFELAWFGVANPAGTIRLHLSRYLHLTLDLVYRPAGGRQPAIAAPLRRLGPVGDAPAPLGPARSFAPSVPELSEVAIAPRYTLRTQRRIRSGEVHYFDHPFFGVIVLVEPYEPPEDAEDDALQPAA